MIGKKGKGGVKRQKSADKYQSLHHKGLRDQESKFISCAGKNNSFRELLQKWQRIRKRVH